MNGIPTALGVQCDHCHAPAHLPPGKALTPGEETLDFALDEKPAKRTARQMLIMLRTINAMVPGAVGKPAGKAMQVKCATCHHGMQPPPQQMAEVLGATTAEKGVPAAIAQFKNLRH